MKSTPIKMEPNLQDLLRDIRGKDIGLRMAAIEKLKHSPGRHVNVFLELADDREQDVRVLGCGLLAAVKPAGALKVLLRKTRDTDPNVREAACTALGMFRSAQAVKGLTEALHDKPWIACAAACSLGEIGGKQSFTHLMKLFHQGDSLTATAACQALLRWDDPGVVDEIVRTIGKWTGRRRDRFVRIVLEQGGKEILDRLRYALGDEIIGHLQYLSQREHKTSMRLITLAAQIGSQEACRLILQELAKRDPDEEDLPEILALFGGLGAVWRDQLDVYLDLPDEGVILALVKVCAATGTKIKEVTLQDILSRSSLETKREIARNLARIADPSVRLIECLLSDTDDHIKGDTAEAAAFFAMGELSSRIAQLARTGFMDTRKKALRSLCVLDRSEAEALAEEFVTQGNADDKRIYLSAVEGMDKETNYRLILKLLHSRETRIVAATVSVMGRLVDHDTRYQDLIRQVFTRRKVLPEVLELIKEKKLTTFEPQLLDLLEELRQDPWTLYQALSALAAMEDGNLFDVFATGLKDERNLVKIACIKALAGLRQKRAVEIISPFLKSADADLRKAAKTALDALADGHGGEAS